MPSVTAGLLAFSSFPSPLSSGALDLVENEMYKAPVVLERFFCFGEVDAHSYIQYMLGCVAK